MGRVKGSKLRVILFKIEIRCFFNVKKKCIDFKFEYNFYYLRFYLIYLDERFL